MALGMKVECIWSDTILTLQSFCSGLAMLYVCVDARKSNGFSGIILIGRLVYAHGSVVTFIWWWVLLTYRVGMHVSFLYRWFVLTWSFKRERVSCYSGFTMHGVLCLLTICVDSCASWSSLPSITLYARSSLCLSISHGENDVCLRMTSYVMTS